MIILSRLLNSSEWPEGVGVRFSKALGSHPSCWLTDVADPALSVEGVIGLLPSRISKTSARFSVGIASMVRLIPDRAMGLHRFNGGLHAACPMRSDGCVDVSGSMTVIIERSIENRSSRRWYPPSRYSPRAIVSIWPLLPTCIVGIYPMMAGRILLDCSTSQRDPWNGCGWVGAQVNR